ncbi:hypothetical protein BH11MYX3_BH11MYX3_49050 [soil metagenome]
MVTFTFAPICEPGSPYSIDYAAAVVAGQPLPLFTMLMPAGWQHAPTQIRRPLYTGTPLEGIPDVALVYLVPTPDNGMPNLGWVKSDRATALGATVADFERTALHNLARRPASWSMSEVTPGRLVAMCEDDYLAAERILDPEFLREAAIRLGVPGQPLIVGIPTRGVLIAAAYSESRYDGIVAQTIQRMFDEARNKPICPVPFLVRDGQLTAALEVG